MGLKGFCCILNNIPPLLKIRPINKQATCKTYSCVTVDHSSPCTLKIVFWGKCYNQLCHNYLKQCTYLKKVCEINNKTTSLSSVLENNINTAVGIMNNRPIFSAFLFYLKLNTLIISTLHCQNLAWSVLIYKI